VKEPQVVLFEELWVLKNEPYPKIPNLKVRKFNKTSLKEADAFVSMNIDNPASLNHRWRGPIFHGIKSTGKPVLYFESPVFRQNIKLKRYEINPYRRVGWDHFLRSGKFNNENSPPDRWEFWKKEQNLEIQDWRKPNKDGHILITLQKENDSSLISLRNRWGNQNNYVIELITSLRRYFENKIVIRPHPLYSDRTKLDRKIFSMFDNVELSSNLQSSSTANGGEGLEKDLEGISFIVGYNSNTLIETVMKGIPTVTIDSDAHSHPVSVAPNKIYDFNEYSKDRMQWLYDLSYCQWTDKEIQNGTTWAHLKRVYF
jgi:hypothetical protein